MSTIDATAFRKQWELQYVGPRDPQDPYPVTERKLPPRIQQMIDVLLANQAIICQYPYGHIELHYKDGQVQAMMKHQLLGE